MSTLLRETTREKGASRWSRALVAIQRGHSSSGVPKGRDRVPFFCVHGAGGNVLNFRAISIGVDPAQPFYGLQASGVDGESAPHDSVEAMARAYLAEVRAFRAHGPYLLGGYSGGGLVAFEMARLLTIANEPVGLLALLDTYHPDTKLRRMTFATRIARLREEGISYVVGALRRRREDEKRASDRRAIEGHRARGEIIPFELRDLHLVEHFRAIARRYRPRPWSGRATLFRTRSIKPIYEDPGPTYGWDRCALGGVEIVEIPGDHRTMMHGTNARLLGRALDTALERAQADSISRA